MNANRFTDTFREEASELLGNLESLLLELEKNPEDGELLSAIFRAMHTIKGSAGMVGLERICKFAHEVESILSALRDGKIAYSRAITDNTLIARDYITDMLGDTEHDFSASDKEVSAFLAAFRQAAGFEPAINASACPCPAVPTVNKGEKKRSLHIRFKPFADVFRRGTNPVALIAELRTLGESVCIPNSDGVPALSLHDAESCAVAWDVFLRTAASDNDIRDIFVFVENQCEIAIEDLGNSVDGDHDADGGKKLGEILVESGKIEKETLDRFLDSRKKIGELLMEEKLVSETDIKVALEEQKQIQTVKRERKNDIDSATVRVRSEKLDKLMALVGELVTVQARVFETAKRHEDDVDFLSVAEQFGRLTDELRTNTMSIRMVSVGSTFSAFKRLVRDLSNELGKKIELETSGEETELDKTVIERLHDPLVHIVRNCIDHGIEKPEMRVARGKPETGRITLRAEQSGSSVIITVEDDGNGLDREAIKKKAIAKGLIARDADIGEQDLIRLILLPGFSTSETVTSVSGRGVGMDVVNRQMESIGGTIAIETVSQKHCRFILKIPLTLAIIDGLLVRVSDEYFVIPLSVVRGCEEIPRKNAGRTIIVYQNRQLPTIDSRGFFGIPGDHPEIEHVVVVSSGASLYGLVVDRILGGMQAVIKPLGKTFKSVRGVSGATIRGDGSIALILDTDTIIS